VKREEDSKNEIQSFFTNHRLLCLREEEHWSNNIDLFQLQFHTYYLQNIEQNKNKSFFYYFFSLSIQTSARKEIISIFMKWNCHNTISKIECFLNTIAMMNINVDIEYTFVISTWKWKFSRRKQKSDFVFYLSNSRIAMTISLT